MVLKILAPAAAALVKAWILGATPTRENVLSMIVIRVTTISERVISPATR
jgi:hypothetical protein